MIRLLIADDHAIVRGGLKQIFALVPDIEVVGEAASGSDVLERLRQLTPDLLLMDLNMPGVSGTDLMLRVRACNASLPVLVLSMNNEPVMAARMLKAGASGYITKACEPGILLAAIRKVAGGGKYIDPDLAEKMVFDVACTAPGAPHTQLSDRELEVLRLLVQGKTVNDIALQLVISNKTVSTHKVRLMEKMHIASMAELMRYALQHGL